MTDMNIIEQAMNDLHHTDEHTRAAAINTLGDARYAPAIPRLTDLMLEADPGTRYLAAMALSRMGDEAESAVPSLLQTLRAEDMFLRAAVTNALIQIGYPSVPGLIRALFDDNKAVRRAAAKALGKIGHGQAVSALCVARKDGDAGVRKFALEALSRIDTPEARAALND